MIQARISDETAKRLQDHTGRPITKGVDKAMIQCLDELDELKAKADTDAIEMTVCDHTKETMNEDG